MDDERALEVFGGAVRGLRERNGWSQTELAERMGRWGHPMVYQTVAKMEKGTRQTPVPELVTLARVFGVSLGELMAPLDDELRLNGSDAIGGFPSYLIAAYMQDDPRLPIWLSATYRETETPELANPKEFGRRAQEVIDSPRWEAEISAITRQWPRQRPMTNIERARLEGTIGTLAEQLEQIEERNAQVAAKIEQIEGQIDRMIQAKMEESQSGVDKEA